MAWYELKLVPDEDTLLVTAPAFPEVTSFGDDEASAVKHGLDAIEEAIAGRIAAGQDLPQPLDAEPARGRFVKLPALTALKSQLYTLLRQRGVSRAELQRRLGWHREQVDRLFRLDHRSRLDQLEAAIEALGGRVSVAVLDREAAA